MAWNVVETYAFNPSGTGDNASQLAHLAEDLRAYANAKKPLPKVVFPEGIYDFSAWPDLAINNLQLVGEGEVYLRHTGTGKAILFDGNSTGPNGGGQFNLIIDNLRVVPSSATENTVTLIAIHHSYVNMRVLGVGVTGSKAISTHWCVGTELANCSVCLFDSVVSPIGGGNYDCTGLWLDKVTEPADWQTTDCYITNPIIENVRVGINLADAGGIIITGGIVETCSDTGIVVTIGGQNRSYGTWVENNFSNDLVFLRNAHDNLFDLAHPSRLKVEDNGYLGSNNKVTSTTVWWEQGSRMTGRTGNRRE